MTESEWLECTDPELMVDWITTGGGKVTSQHKLDFIEDAVFARFGFNLHSLVMQDEPLAGTCDIIRDIVGNPFRKVVLPKISPCCHYCGAARWVMVTGEEDVCWCQECKKQFHWPTNSYKCPWLTPAAISLAQAAYNIRCRGCNQCYDGWLPGECIRPCPNTTDGTLDPARLAVLADALEEAGCNNGYILRHLRGWEPCRWCFGGSHGSEQACGGYDYRKHDWGFHGWMKCSSHYRGCWVLDLLLGKN